jgi:peptidoglycan/LPS O-acetylase OafA/YrhL
VLDGLRGVAACAVLLMHTGFARMRNAGLAVDLFFLLSGFVIAYSYQDRLARGMPVRDFLRRRLIRLYPMIAFAGLASFAVALAVPGDDVWQALGLLLRAMLLVPVLQGTGDTFPLNPPLWSLSFEALANLAYCLIAARLSRRVLAGLVAVAAVAVTAGGLGGNAADTLWAGFPRTIAGFFGGVLLHELWRTGSLPRWRSGLLLPGAGLCLLFTAPVSAGSAAYPLAMAVMVLLLLPAINAAAGAREASVCGFLGAVSYPLYILHMPVFTLLRAGLVRTLGDTAGLGGFLFSHGALISLGTAMAILPVCAAVLVVYDEPVRRALGRRRSGAALA